MLVAFVGAAGNAIVFLCLYVVLILVGAGLFCYASHCFLVVIEQSAAGNDEVTWPNEPYHDWIWRGAVIAWLMLVWLAPLGVVLKLACRDIYIEQPALAALFALVALWLFFPIGVLSSLLASTRWAFLHPQAFRALALRPSAALSFYAATLPLLAAAAGLWIAAFVVSGLLIPVAALAAAVALLVYARLLGRFLWIVATPSGKKRRGKKKRAKDECSALPPLIIPRPQARPSEAGEGYVLAEAEAAPAGTSVEDDERQKVRDSYDMADDPDAEQKKEKELVRELLEPVQRRVARAQGHLEITHAPRSLWGGIYSFPFYDKSQRAWVYLAALGTGAGIVLNMLIAGTP